MSTLVLLGDHEILIAVVELLSIVTKKSALILGRFSSISIFDDANTKADNQDASNTNVFKNIPTNFQLDYIQQKHLNSLTKDDLIINAGYTDIPAIIKMCARKSIRYISCAVADNFTSRSIGSINLFNLFEKLALKKLAYKVLMKAKNRGAPVTPKLKRLSAAYKNDNFKLLAYLLQVRTIHYTERDTSVFKKPNTYGSTTFYNMCMKPIEMTWGQHEKQINKVVKLPIKYTQAKLSIATKGINGIVRTFVPDINNTTRFINSGIRLGIRCSTDNSEDSGHTAGMLLRNNIMLNNSLAYKKYNPSCYYVSCPCLAAWESIKRIKSGSAAPVTSGVVNMSDIKNGDNAIGVLLITENNQITNDTQPSSYWCGSILSFSQAKKMGFKHVNYTSIQIAACLLSVTKWVIENSNAKVTSVGDLPYDEILKGCRRWLGTIYSNSVPFDINYTTFLDEFLTSLN